MKIEATKEWWLKMAALEGDSEIGAGLLAIDPVFGDDGVPTAPKEDHSDGAGS